MRKLLFLAGVFLGMFLWFSRNTPGIGGWLRRISDIPATALLLGTSDLERDGVDPAKS